MYLVPTICLCLRLALWSGHPVGWALVGRHERDGVLFHLNWKARVLHISSLFETTQGLSILLVKLKNNFKDNKLSVGDGLRPWILRGISELSSF